MKINKLTVSIFTFFLLITFGGSEFFAQEIPLESDSSENTYKTWNVNGILDIQVRDAKDRGKSLKGTHKLKYKCKKESGVVFSRDVNFTNGNSNRLRDICAKIIAEVITAGEKKIKLTSGAGTNGFTVIKEGDSTFLKTNNVIDPATQKPLEGSQQISVAVYPDYEPSGLFAVHIVGNSKTRFRRMLLNRIENPAEFIDGIIIVSNSRNTSDDSSGGVDVTDSTNRGKQSSSISDDASVGNTSTPVRADSSLPKQNKSSSDDKLSNENENTASNGRETKTVKLIKDGRKNGYKTWKKDGFHFFQANNIVDPITKKLVEGLHDLSYRCGSGNSLTRIKLKLSRGNTQRVAIACALIKEPEIILLDEPTPN